MRILLLLAVFIAACCLRPGAAAASRFSGAYLMQLCDSDAKGKEIVKGGHTACQAYISGVIDYHDVLQSLDLAPKVDICLPKTITSGQLQAIVVTFLKNNKEHDAFIAAPAVTMALYQVYPCRVAGKKKKRGF